MQHSIKENEIKIGNYILYLNELYVVDGIKYEPNAPTHKYRIAFKTIDGKLRNAKMTNWIEAIPLDEDLLKKLGWIWNEKMNSFEKHPNGDARMVLEYRKINGSYTMYNYVLKAMIAERIFYVHQLQNLYFCLTGKDLEFVS